MRTRYPRTKSSGQHGNVGASGGQSADGIATTVSKMHAGLQAGHLEEATLKTTRVGHGSIQKGLHSEQ